MSRNSGQLMIVGHGVFNGHLFNTIQRKVS